MVQKKAMGQSTSRVFISPKTHFNNSFSQDRVKKKGNKRKWKFCCCQYEIIKHKQNLDKHSKVRGLLSRQSRYPNLQPHSWLILTHCPFLPHNHSCKLQASKNYYPATLSRDGHLAHTALSGSSWFVETWANVHYQPYSVKKTYLLPLVKLRKLQVAAWPSEKDMTRIPCNVTQLYNLGHPPGCNCKLILMNRT